MERGPLSTAPMSIENKDPRAEMWWLTNKGRKEGQKKPKKEF